MTCLKNPGTFAFPGLWPLCNLRGRCHPVNALKFSLQLSSEAGALIQRQGLTFKSCLIAPRLARLSPYPCPLVDETAHANVHHNSHRHKHEQQGRATIAHQGQRNSGDGHKPNHHACVDQDVK